MGGSSESVDSQAPPVRSSHKPKRRRWIPALVFAVSIVVAGLIWALTVTGWLAFRLTDTSPRALQRQFRDLPLGSAFTLIAEEHTNTCIGGCRLVDRYYTSDLTVEDACVEIGRKLAQWGNVGPDQTRPGVWCSFRGSKNQYYVSASVTKDRTIDTPTATQREITEPHQSVLFIGLSDG